MNQPGASAPGNFAVWRYIMKAHETCESCGQPFPLAHLTDFDGSQLCSDCLESGTLFCARCGTRIWREDDAGNPEAPLCQSCYDRFYISCSNCGRILHQDEACFDRSDNAYVGFADSGDVGPADEVC